MEKSGYNKPKPRRLFGLSGVYENKKYNLPLSNQEINAKIYNSIATIQIAQTYENDTSESMEVTLSIPVQKNFSISKLRILLGDKEVEGKIFEKEKAEEKYDDAIAQGHTAALANEKKDEDKNTCVELILGNLLPN